MIVSYQFYKSEYPGALIEQVDWARFEKQAEAHLDRLKRTYQVERDEHKEKLAVCAIADCIANYDSAAESAMFSSVHIGSVSASTGMSYGDVAASKMKEIYKAARLYLNIYRGAGNA